MSNFILEYGNTIIYAVLTAILSYIGLYLKAEITKYINLKEKKEVVKTCVLSSNRLYKNLTNKERYENTVNNIVNILSTRNIPVTDFEIELLIDEACENLDCSHLDIYD